MQRAADASGFDYGDPGGGCEEGGCFAEFDSVGGWGEGWVAGRVVIVAGFLLEVAEASD